MELGLDQNKKTILIIAACVVLIYVDVSYILKAQLRAHELINPQIAAMKADLVKLEADIAGARAIEQKAGSKDAPVKKFLEESQLDSLLQEISNTAARRGVNIISMQKRAYKEAAAKPSKFTPYLVHLNLTGDYNGLGQFIDDLENSASFIAANNMTISSGKKDIYTQDATLALKTYVVK